jgi:hypothetical protein
MVDVDADFPIYIQYCRDGYLDKYRAWAVWTSTMPEMGVKDLDERVREAEHVLLLLLSRMKIPQLECTQRIITKHSISQKNV